MNATCNRLSLVKRFGECLGYQQSQLMKNNRKYTTIIPDGSAAVFTVCVPSTSLLFVTKNTTRKQGLSTTTKRHMRWNVLNDDGYQSVHCDSFYIVLPTLPDETPENNLFLESLSQNRDWPPLNTATPEEFYQGTVKLILETGAPFWEHVERLEEEREKKIPSPDLFTFNKVLAPILTDHNDMLYALATLHLKMLTDWPSCHYTDLYQDFDAVNRLLNDHITEHQNAQIIMELVQKFPDSELAKLNQWQRSYVEWLKLEWKMYGKQPDPIHKKRDQKEQDLMDALFEGAHSSGAMFMRRSIVDPDPSNVKITINDRALLKHAPPHVLKILAKGSDPEQGPWETNANSPGMFEMFKYSSAHGHKKQLWEALIARASRASAHQQLDNSLAIHDMRYQYDRIAKQLDFKTFAHYQLSTKMIGNPDALREFISALYTRFRPVLIERFDDWRKYAEEEENLQFDELAPSDMFYICRREAEHRHKVSTLNLMKYFPVWQTFEKILVLIRMIFSIEFKDITNKPKTASLERCHPSVHIFEVTDKITNEHLGRVYVDIYEREGKNINRWATSLWRMPNKDKGQDKLIWMIGNTTQTDPATGHSELLHYEQLLELLEAFGSLLRLLLSRSPIPEMNGPIVSQASEWDAADFLPTFLQFFIYKPNLLKAMSSPHVETGQPLSTQVAQDTSLALARSTFWDTWRYLFWTDYALTLFEFEEPKDKNYFDLYKEMYEEYFPFRLEETNYQPCSMMALFTPFNFACMYYRRLWCEALALDVHQTFDNEADLFLTGKRLKTTWLNNGALKSQWNMYKQFQGRPPNILAISNFHDPLPDLYGTLDIEKHKGRKAVQNY